MPLHKIMKGLPSDFLAAKGLLYQDWSSLTPCQRECMTRLGMTIQIEQEAYLTEHPEVGNPKLLSTKLWFCHKRF